MRAWLTDLQTADIQALPLEGERRGFRHTAARSFYIIVGVFVTGLVALTSCGNNGAADNRSSTPSTSASAQGPVLPSDGATLYAANCASCHGADLKGTSIGPSQLSIVYEPGHHSDDSYRSAILNGVQPHHWNFGPMAPVPGLSDQQIESIIAFIRKVQAEQGFEPYPPR